MPVIISLEITHKRDGPEITKHAQASLFYGKCKNNIRYCFGGNQGFIWKPLPLPEEGKKKDPKLDERDDRSRSIPLSRTTTGMHSSRMTCYPLFLSLRIATTTSNLGWMSYSET